MEKLDEKYGGEKRLLQRHLEAVLRASPVEETNLKELEIFSDRSAGFHAQKWCSNRTELLEEIPQEDRATGVKLDNSELPSVKTLVVR